MKNKNFKIKLIFLCVFLTLVSAIIGGVSTFGVSELATQSESFSNDIIPRKMYLDEMNVSYQKTRIEVRTLGLQGINNIAKKDAIANTKKMINQFEEAERNLEKLITNEEEKKIFKDLHREWIAFKKVGARALELAQLKTKKADDELYEIFLVDCPEAAANFQRVLDLYVAKIENEVASSAHIVKNTSNKLLTIIGLVSVIGALFGLTIGVRYATKISNMVLETISSLTHSSHELVKSAKSIATSSSELTRSSERQDSSLQESSSSLEEISSMVRMTAENAKSSNELASISLEKAGVGKGIVKKMISSMGEIDEDINLMLTEFNNNSDKMLKIVELINRIEERTQVINDIVFQTKLLSFNASVEAARAGEAGKGFAVVAEEVGKLAQMSGNASVEISEMVGTSVSEVNHIIEESNNNLKVIVEKVRNSVTSGSDVANECGGILDDIVASVANVGHSIEEITSAALEQSKGITELQKSISEIDLSSKSNTGIAKGNSSIAENLLSEVNFVNRSIGDIELVFKGQDQDDVRSHLKIAS